VVEQMAMENSMPGQAAIGGRGRQYVPGRKYAPGRSPPPRRSPRDRGRSGRAGEHRWRWRRPSFAVAGLLSAGYSSLRAHRRLRIALLASLLALALLLGGWFWFRDSPLVSVRRVQISGVQGPDAGAIEAALTRAARRMTTLDVRPAALRAAVARFRIVQAVRVRTSFPHGMQIQVLEQLPVGTLAVNGQRTAVAADGAVLGPAFLSAALPTVATSEPAVGQRVRGSEALAALTVLGAARRPLLKAVERVFFGPKGLTVSMRNGLLAYFGDATRPHAKWLALARVLLAPGAAGASYVDVRLPERPAAGFSAGSAPEAGSANAESASSATPASTAELAASLAGTGGGGTSAGSATAAQQATGTAAPGASSTPAAEAPAGTPAAVPAQSAAPSSQASGSAATESPPASSPQEPATGAAPGG
jgi:cell division protein FtsQ